MSVKNFPATQRVKVMETGELVGAGGVQTAAHMEAGYLQLLLYVNGALAGTEQLRVRIFHDQALTKLYATSAWSALSAISGMGTYWLGRLLFTFNHEPLNKTQVYWVGVESTGYTRSGNTFYLGFCQDWSFGQVGQAQALWMALYGYRWLG